MFSLTSRQLLQQLSLSRDIRIVMLKVPWFCELHYNDGNVGCVLIVLWSSVADIRMWWCNNAYYLYRERVKLDPILNGNEHPHNKYLERLCISSLLLPILVLYRNRGGGSVGVCLCICLVCDLSYIVLTHDTDSNLSNNRSCSGLLAL